MESQTAQFAARMWLETDAAFGLREVPLVLPSRIPTAVEAARPSAAVGRAPMCPTPISPAPRPLAATRPHLASAPAIVPMAANARETSVTNQGAAIPRNVTLPPIPADPLAGLPPIRAADKPRLMAELEQQAIAALTPYLSTVATKVVFGDGDPAAALMFVGEGPGVEEDKTGKPFVGRSGQLLDRMITAMGLSRQTVYIGNVVKLRAAEIDADTGKLRDRPPTPAEVALNIAWLHKQIEIIRPQVIVTLGVPALKHLTGLGEGISRVRGTWLEYRGVPLMPTYHPSYVLRSYTPENRAKVWGDLQQVMARLGLKLSRSG